MGCRRLTFLDRRGRPILDESVNPLRQFHWHQRCAPTASPATDRMHLLLAVDGSLLSDAAFHRALALAQEMKARVTALRVGPKYHVLAYHTEMLTDSGELFAEEISDSATKLISSETQKILTHSKIPVLVYRRHHPRWPGGI